MSVKSPNLLEVANFKAKYSPVLSVSSLTNVSFVRRTLRLLVNTYENLIQINLDKLPTEYPEMEV